MAKAIRITREQYLALLELGAPVLVSVLSVSSEYALAALLQDQQSHVGLRWRKAWAESIHQYIFWTLVDSE